MVGIAAMPRYGGAALCDILDYGVADLIEVIAEPTQVRKTGTGSVPGKATASEPKRTWCAARRHGDRRGRSGLRGGGRASG